MFRGFKITIVKHIASQLLVALRSLAALKIVHCDLKPENILLNKSGQLDVTVRNSISCYVTMYLLCAASYAKSFIQESSCCAGD